MVNLGKLTYTDPQFKGDTYEGSFHKGKRHEQGTYLHANGAKYVGNWLNSHRNGKGKMKFPNGDIYEGNYIDDVRENIWSFDKT